MTDTAEYWDDIHRHKRAFIETKIKQKPQCIPAYLCEPRDVPDGTPFKWFCKHCGHKMNKANYRNRDKITSNGLLPFSDYTEEV